MDRARGKTEAGDASVSASAVTDDPTLLSPPAAKRVRKNAGSEACSEDSPSEKPAVEMRRRRPKKFRTTPTTSAVEIDDDPVDLPWRKGSPRRWRNARWRGRTRPGPAVIRRRAAPVGDGGEGNG